MLRQSLSQWKFKEEVKEEDEYHDDFEEIEEKENEHTSSEEVEEDIWIDESDDEEFDW